MKHINAFTIHSFRGISELRLEELGQVNLLVGGNNSGKTTVLEALALFCDPFNTRTWLDAASLRDMREAMMGLWVRGLLNRLAWLFPQDEEGKSSAVSEISLAALGNIPRAKLSAHYEKFSRLSSVHPGYIKEANANYDPLYLKESEGMKLYLSETNSDGLQPSTIEKSFEFYDDRPPDIGHYQFPILPVQLINSFSHRQGGLSARLWSDVVNADLKQEIMQLLHLFDSNIEDVDIISSSESQEPLVTVKHKKLGHAPLTTFGDGLRHVFTLATAIPGARHGLLLVDDVELAIHTRMLEKSINWLVSACIQNNVQLFVTTHSLEAVDEIIDACKDDAIDLVAYRLYKNSERITSKRSDKGLITRLRENLGADVRF